MRLRYLFVGALLLLAVVVVAIWMRSPAEHVGDTGRAVSPPAPRQLVTGGEARDAEGTAITGRVTDASTATPIERARLCSVASTRRLGRFSFSTRCVRTDRAGAYELNASAPLRIDVEAQGFLPISRALVAGQRVMDFALEPAGVLVSGVVGDALGGVIERANVVAWSDTVHIGATSDEDGVFSLWMSDLESYRLLARADGYAANSTVVFPFRMRHVEILLSPGLVLRGRVVDAKSGRGIPDVRVHANAPRMGMYRWQPRTTPTATTDGEGRFAIDRLPPGVYRPQASSVRGVGTAEAPIELVLGRPSREARIVLRPAGAISGRVVIGDSDRPCPNATVNLRNAGGKTVAAADGDEVGAVEFLGVVPGTYTVVIRCPGFVSEPDYPPINVSSDPLEPARWPVHEGIVVRGRVTDVHGDPVSRVRVEAFPPDLDHAAPQNDRFAGWTATTGKDGAFVFSDLVEGRFLFKVLQHSPASGEWTELELVDGQEPPFVRLEAKERVAVSGIVIGRDGEAAAGARVRVLPRRKGVLRGMTEMDREGRFSLAPGPYEITAVAATGRGSVSLVLSEGASRSDVRIALVHGP